MNIVNSVNSVNGVNSVKRSLHIGTVLTKGSIKKYIPKFGRCPETCFAYEIYEY